MEFTQVNFFHVRHCILEKVNSFGLIFNDDYAR